METLRAVVTGASSGIGAATVRQLREQGWDVVAVARREERLRALCEETGASYVVADLTDDAAVAALTAEVLDGGPVHSLVANAGAAYGTDTVAEASVDGWRDMFEVNVLGVLRVVKAFLPALIESGRGDIVVMSSTAGHQAYEGGGGYVAAKHGTHSIAATLRLELAGEPVRVIEIAPGMVATEEFTLKRVGGSQDRADKVYEGVENPLTAADVADAVVYSLTRPHHFNVDLMVIRPIAQAAQHKVARNQGL
ncbi:MULTISPECIES: SDR family oxidoreductase [Brevibacterium]|uniref:NADP-dependent 3-hydroxy acid dehydrogenase YdfG n=2 Tax=Brevibacterium antiquum TaxID=234835 RepID=A0A2H1HUQ4_9MICO|nr:MULTISPECIES: SDR family oxidoreductase [Brevibacterium]SMX66648.1 NADP-dependent 3-hydroxy acid dehydrogenase YdfG [Brevibacterium antiquum CNRZ 918]SMX91072.1 NADP-dependent 3-hydroxy acid dehydrogenase YdfG [Brevibacterium antiquum]HCG56347.1 SDR family NAD(P)-dependent oxidoreductase [Brevibacterium sp.]